MPDTDFVVYGYLRKDYGSFYYIGKGRPDRPYSKSKRTIPHPGCRSRIVILYKNIEEQVALDIEKKLISLMGRIGIEPWGTLRNINPGGEGVSKKHSEELKQKKYLYRHEKLSQKRKNWFHSVVGEVYNLTHKELSEMFPEQRLSVTKLLHVSRGGKNFYKGWRLLENQLLPNFLTLAKPADWYHKKYGEFLNKTCRKIVDMFDKDNLNIDYLRSVLSGKNISYKGWRLLKNKDYMSPTRSKRDIKTDWFHKNCGEQVNKSSREILESFNLPEKSWSRLEKVRSGGQKSHLGWTLIHNRNYVPNNTVKLQDWEHEEYGVIRGFSAGDLVKMFPDQKLTETCLLRVARNPLKRSHRGWFIEGHLRIKPEEKRANWYHPDHGAFFDKTSREIKNINGDPRASPSLFEKLIKGRGKTTRGWIVLKKTLKVAKKPPKAL